MNRISVKTAGLREQADKLNREALRYNRRFSEMEDCISWVRRQDFDGADEVYRTLKKQNEEMLRQRKSLLLLGESLRRISDKYDRTEERIIDQGEHIYSGRLVVCSPVILNQLNQLLKNMGLQVSDPE